MEVVNSSSSMGGGAGTPRGCVAEDTTLAIILKAMGFVSTWGPGWGATLHRNICDRCTYQGWDCKGETLARQAHTQAAGAQ